MRAWQRPEHARECQQEQHGDSQRAGVDRERQDGGQAEQPAAGGRARQLAAHDLPGDDAGVGLVQVGRLDKARHARRRGGVAQR